MKNKKLIVVLGMHRSGTSAITRGLQVMGVQLGNNLMNPTIGVNDKGFWEDIDLNTLNIEILKALDSDWQHFAPTENSYVELLHNKDFFLRAVEVLQKKVIDVPSFGFKDPRIAKLLPFWKTVFIKCKFDVSYILTIRHPLSVVKSLAKAHGIEAEHSYLLWLSHVLMSLTNSAGAKRVLLDFDRLMKSPEHELNRIAKFTGLKIDTAELQRYKFNFLDNGLRHTVFELDDLLADDSCPPIVSEIYTALIDVASDKVELDDEELQGKIIRWTDEYTRLKSSLNLIDKLIKQNVAVTQAATERDRQINSLNHTIAERDRQINSLNHTIAERDGQIDSLNHTIAECDGQIDSLNHTIAERDGQIDILNQTIAERDGQINSLNQAVIEKDRQITEILSCRSWRMTLPLRAISHQLKRIRKLWRSVSLIVQQRGGFSKAVFKTFGVLKREGWPGIKRSLLAAWQSVNQSTTIDSNRQTVDRNDYVEWILRYDTLSYKSRSRMVELIEGFDRKPLFSVIMPTYNTRPEWLVEAIESVRMQIYPNWELCIADDASTNEDIRPILERYVKEDLRIKVIFREKNGHISASTNSALGIATGEYIVLLDHDDLLAEHALFWVADAINRYPDAQLIYSDEDKIDSKGRRSSPYFKCDWNTDLFYSHNMICHLGVYRTKLIRDLNGFRKGFEGAQDYDLALRCIERIEENQIVHIPRILYHWRIHSESTSAVTDAKPYALLAGQRALNDHFERTGVAGRVELLDFGMYRLRYSLPENLPLVSLIILTRNGFRLLKQCIESIFEKTKYPNYEIIIVDNGSDDVDTLRYFMTIKDNQRVRVLNDSRSFNFSALNNAAVKVARGDLICLLNNDIEIISPDWLTEMVSLALQEGVGAVGAKLWYPNDTLQHGGVILGIGGVAGHSHKHLSIGQYGYFGRACLTQGISAITAACLVVRKSVYNEVEGLNETDLQIAFNDIDFCLRIQESGYRNVWTPYAELYHHESATRGYEDTPEKQARFASEVRYMNQRWGNQLANDPAYSPNLTLSHEDFSLAWPPRVKLL